MPRVNCRLLPHQLVLVVTQQQHRRARVTFRVFSTRKRQLDLPAIGVTQRQCVVFNFVGAGARRESCVQAVDVLVVQNLDCAVVGKSSV